MPNYTAPGTENLRASERAFHATPPEPPSASGADIGGTENRRANATTHRAGIGSTPGGTDPAPVQSFRDGSV